MSKTFIALGVLAALSAPAAAQQLTSPRVNSQIVSDTFVGNTPAIDATTTRSIGFDGVADGSSNAGNGNRTGVAADLFGANSR